MEKASVAYINYEKFKCALQYEKENFILKYDTEIYLHSYLIEAENNKEKN